MAWSKISLRSRNFLVNISSYILHTFIASSIRCITLLFRKIFCLYQYSGLRKFIFKVYYFVHEMLAFIK